VPGELKRVGKAPLSCIPRKRAVSFRNDESGAAAMEFGLIAVPFVVMCFFVINIGMYYFTVNSIDNGILGATRQVLTGTAQTSGMTVGGFQQLVCTDANIGGSNIDCTKLHILLASTTTNWGALETAATTMSCVNNGSLSAGTGSSTDLLSAYTSGSAAYVIAIACYEWTGSQYLPFFPWATLSDGSTLIQSAIAFQTEPYS